MTSKNTHMIWITWHEESVLELEDVAIYNMEHLTVTRNVTVKNSNKGKKMEEECVPSSSTCVLFVKEELKLITFLD